MTYYENELKKLVDMNGLKIKISSNTNETNWINLNLESINILLKFLEKEENLLCKFFRSNGYKE